MSNIKVRKSGNISNLIRVYRRDGRKKTWEQFKIRFYEQATPERLVAQEMYGYIGSLGGLILAIIITYLNGLWYISIIMFFAAWITYVKLKGCMKQRRTMKEIMELYK